METVSHFRILFAYVRTIPPFFFERIPGTQCEAVQWVRLRWGKYLWYSVKQTQAQPLRGGIGRNRHCFRPFLLKDSSKNVDVISYFCDVHLQLRWWPANMLCLDVFWWKQSIRLELGCVRSLFEVASSLLNALLAAKSRRSLDVETMGNGKL